MPPPYSPTIIRTEQARVLWSPETDNQGNLVYGQINGTAFQRFGIHDEMTMPDPVMEWTPYYGIASSRSRSDIFPGKWTLRGAVPNIRLQRGAASGGLSGSAPAPSIPLFGLCIGTTMTSPQQPNLVLAVEREAVSFYDGRLTSFNIAVLAFDTAGGQYIRQYTGCKVNRWTLHATEGGVVTLSLDEILCSRMWHNRNGIPGYLGIIFAPPDPGPWYGGQFFFSGAAIAIGSSNIGRVKSVTLSGDNGLVPRYYLVGGANSELVGGNPGTFGYTQTPNDLPEGKRSYTMTLELDVVDPTFNYDYVTDLLWRQGREPNLGLVAGNPVELVFLNADAVYANSGQETVTQMLNQMANFATAPSYVLYINCFISALEVPGGQSFAPAAVVSEGSINLPPPPQGYWDGRLSLNLNSLQFAMSY